MQCFELCPLLVVLFDKEMAANVHAGISGGTFSLKLGTKACQGSFRNGAWLGRHA